ncbi:MAG: glycosyltransferase family 4 protein [Pseudomonadota bacterium]
MARSLTVIQTLPELNSGGVERGTLEIARALVAQGHRSIVISHGGRLVKQLEAEGSQHITLPIHRKSLRSLFQVRPLRRILEEIKPDIVHARSRVPAWITFLALRKMAPLNRPHFITTVHGLYSISPYSAVMTFGERVIVVSNTVKQYVLENYPRCAPEKIRLIYRGVTPNEFPFGLSADPDWLATWKTDFPELAGKTIIAIPGRLSRVKGHETFLELMKNLVADLPDIHGLIIGGAEPAKAAYEQELKTRVSALGLDSRISFTGHRNDMNQVLSQCDLVLSLRVTPEAFGRTTLEPLRLGKPVIGWDVGGVGEILRTMYPFGAVPAGDDAALAARVRQWLLTRPALVETGAFQLDDMCAQTLDTYEQTCQTKLGAHSV